MSTDYQKVFNPRKIIFSQGDAADCLYKVEKGMVGIFINYKEPNEKMIATVQKGEYFGEMALIDDTVRSATAVAMDEKVTLAFYPKSEFEKIVRTEPHVFREILAQMSENLLHLTERYGRVCRTIADYKACEDAGRTPDRSVQEDIDRYAEMYYEN